MQDPQSLSSELVIGFVAPVGVDLLLVEEFLRLEFRRISVEVIVVHVIEELELLLGTTFNQTGAARLEERMNAGNKFCEDLLAREVHAPFANLAMTAIHRSRKVLLDSLQPSLEDEEQADDETGSLPRAAFLVHQLKRAAEVAEFRRVYGESFWLIAASSPLSDRLANLAGRFARESANRKVDEFKADAFRLINRDAGEASSDFTKPFGQNVDDTFHLADLFLDTSDRHSLRVQIRRFVEILFCHPFHTPTIDEQGMNLAWSASLRSSDLSRQVGAAITSPRGSLIALGVNEVPRAGGGQYWCSDEGDGRQHELGVNTSRLRKHEVALDAWNRLHERNLLDLDEVAAFRENHPAIDSDEELAREAFRDSLLLDAIEFGRSVHAEMSALMDAAQKGCSVSGGTLYSTTFPCHLCAPHIVASGLSRVVFVEPYPKSLALDLFKDSIRVVHGSEKRESLQRKTDRGIVFFEPFVGVAPRRFIPLFTMVERKTASGGPVEWEKVALEEKNLREFRPPELYLRWETNSIEILADAIAPL